MTARRPRSLKRQLILRLLPLQAVVLLLAVLVLFWSGQLFSFRSPENTVETLRDALARTESGALVLRPTPGLMKLRASVPDLWFQIRDGKGAELIEGTIPPEYVHVAPALDHIGQARLGWTIDEPEDRPTARLRWVDSDAGRVQIMTGSDGPASPYLVFLGVSLVFLTIVLPILCVMVLALFVATPLVVRRALSGLDRAAAEAQRIDIHQRGVRLPGENVPLEAVPLVKAINDALVRLDEGYDRQQRFLVDAAHELRTPIAILHTRLEALPAGPERTRLLTDAARLSNLAEELLDLQRLHRRHEPFVPVDLAAVGQQVVADLAPLAISAGYELSFEQEAPAGEAQPVTVLGDQAALERALTNLVQNAIEHGGGCGTIAVRVAGTGTIEVSDQGAGIPIEQRAQIFEPFYRLRPRNRGAGLGLSLVKEIVRLHDGHIAVLDAEPKGACFRLRFPTISAESGRGLSIPGRNEYKTAMGSQQRTTPSSGR